MARKSTSATGSAPALLEARDLCVEFSSGRGTVRAVENVSFLLERGGSLGVIGESGSGKSTLVRAAMGLLPRNARITSGQAVFLGRDMTSLKREEWRAVRGKDIGFVSQDPFGALNPILTVEKQFYNVFAAHGRRDRSSWRAEVVSLLGELGIRDPGSTARSHAFELSGGMAQRVVLGLALCLGPKMLVADEPTTALDVIVQRRVLDLIQAEARTRNMGLLLVTHDLSVVSQYLENVIVMKDGKVVEAGKTADVFTSPQSPYAELLVNSSQQVESPGGEKA